MNPVGDIKRFILKAIYRMGTIPMPDRRLRDTAQTVFPDAVKSDIDEAIKDLEDGGYTQAARDDLDRELITWTLTPAGQHKAKSLR